MSNCERLYAEEATKQAMTATHFTHKLVELLPTYPNRQIANFNLNVSLDESLSINFNYNVLLDKLYSFKFVFK